MKVSSKQKAVSGKTTIEKRMSERVVVFFFLLLTAFLSTGSLEAQQSKKVRRVGFLVAGSHSVYSSRVDAFRQGLRELGYVEEQNVFVEYRYAEGKFDRLPGLAAELMRLNVDVIVAAGGIQAIRAAKNAAATTPIVMTGSLDPERDGLVASFARPGGNVTGLSLGGSELYGKRLELLKETALRISPCSDFLVSAKCSRAFIFERNT